MTETQQTETQTEGKGKRPRLFNRLHLMMVLDDHQNTERERFARKAATKWAREQGYNFDPERSNLEPPDHPFTLPPTVRLDRIQRDHAVAVVTLRTTNRKPVYEGKRMHYEYEYEARITRPVGAAKSWDASADAGGEVDMAGFMKRLSAEFDRFQSDDPDTEPWPRPTAKIKEGRLSWRYA